MPTQECNSCKVTVSNYKRHCSSTRHVRILADTTPNPRDNRRFCNICNRYVSKISCHNRTKFHRQVETGVLNRGIRSCPADIVDFIEDFVGVEWKIHLYKKRMKKCHEVIKRGVCDVCHPPKNVYYSYAYGGVKWRFKKSLHRVITQYTSSMHRLVSNTVITRHILTTVPHLYRLSKQLKVDYDSIMRIYTCSMVSDNVLTDVQRVLPEGWWYDISPIDGRIKSTRMLEYILNNRSFHEYSTMSWRQYLH